MAKKFHRMLSVVLAFVMVLSFCTPFMDVFAASEELTEVKQWNLVLGDEIAANFYVSVSDHVSSEAIMNVTDGYGTTSYNLNGTQKDENGNYIFTARMAAAQMGDTITLQLQDGATTGAIHTYKAVDYARVILKGNYSDNTKAMVKAMLNYGAAAQTYFGYNTENLVNVGYESTETVEIPAVEADKIVTGNVSGISFYGASLVFESKVAVRFYFNVTGNIEDYTFSTGKLGAKNGLYYVEVAGINPQQYADTITLTVNDTLTVYYSPLQYISRMYTKTENADLKALLSAMYTYYLAAGAYEAGDEGGSEDNYTEIVVPGGSFGANQGITIYFEPGAYDVVTFDYQITNGGTMDVCLMDSAWSKYYGYFDFGASGLSYEYDGVSYESLGNGYIRVTLDVAKLNRTNLQNNRDNAPETVGILYVRGDWSSAAGSIDNVRLLTKVSGGTEPENPEEPETPVNVSISYEFTGNEANRAGYAEGIVTLSGGNSQENYEIYWGNASGKLTGYKALATLTGANKTLAIGENVMIPAGADRLCVYVGDQVVASYMLESKAYNAQAKTKFAVLSDVHTNYAAGETYLRTVLKKLEAEGVQYVIVTGDIAESANDWGKYVSAVEDSGFTGIMMAAGGNHDLAPEARVELRKYAIYDGYAGAWVSMAEAPAYFANTYAGSLNITAEYTDYEGNGETMYYLVAIEDNAIIFMSQDNRNCNYTNHEDNFSKAQLNFVEDALYRYSQTHNVFIAQHADVEQLVVNPSDGGSMQAYETFPNVMRFVNLLKQYPEAIWMSGHTHSPFASGVQFTDKLYVNGVITDTALARCFGCSSTASSKFTGGSEGYVCYQYENDIVYEARTFKEKDTDGNQENSFVNLTMPQYSYIIPVMIGNSHAQPILPENLIAAEGVTANGTYTVKAGNQSAAWNRDAYLRFYVQTELTNLTVGSVNVDLTAQSGSNYSIIHCIDGWKFVQVAFDSLTTKNGSVDFAVTITGNGSFQLKEMYIEPMDLSWLRGENATQGQNINFDAEVPATDAVIFDYFALPGSELGIALLDDWSNFYGYFAFNENGAAKNYAGITTEKLSDGYIRVTAILSEITQKVESPTKVTSLYIGGKRTTGAGMFDNVQFISGEIPEEPEEPSDPVYRGQEIVVGQKLSVMADQAANYSQVILDMIVPAEGGENEIGIALLDTNWNYYGYFYLEKTGLENPYAGVSAEQLSDGYWRITINIDEIDGSRTHGDVGDIERVYINNHTTGGYIDNVQFIMNDTPEESEPGSGRVLIAGDVHVSADDTYSQNQLRKTLTYAKNNGVDLLIFNGDTVNIGDEADYAALDSVFTDVFGSPEQVTMKFIFNMGNHEFYPTNACAHEETDYALQFARFAEFASKWSDFTAEQGSIYLTEVNGISYVVAAPSDKWTYMSDGKLVYCAAIGGYHENDIALIDSLIAQATAANPGEPVYLLSHHPWGETYGGASYGMPEAKVVTGMRAVMEKYPHLVSVTSHTHFSSLHERSFAQDNWTTINTGMHTTGKYVDIEFDANGEALDYVNIEGRRYNNTDPEGKALHGTTHLVWDIRYGEDRFTATVFNLATETPYSHLSYTVPYGITADNKSEKFAYELTDRKASTLTWSAEDTLAATLVKNGSANTLNLVFSDTDQFYATEGYRIKVINSATGETLKTVLWASRFWAAQDMKDSYEITLDGLTNCDEYTITVEAIDFYGNYSAAKLEATVQSAGGSEEPVGATYAISAGLEIDVADGAYDYISFEYQITNGGELSICALSPDWGKYYGYYSFNNSGKVWEDAGIYAQTLPDGYIRIILKTSELERTNSAYNLANAPETVGLLYVGGSNTATGTIRNVKYGTDSVVPEAPGPIEYRGQEIVAGQDLSVMADQAANYSQVILDMIVPAEGGENEIGIALLDTNWNYYGYFYLEKTGLENPYAGVSAEQLSDGYWRITINIDEIDGSRTHGDVGDIERVYINNHTTGGYIDNVQFVQATPEPDEPEVPDAVNVSYSFSGNEASRAGYAEGTITVSGDLVAGRVYYFCWADANGKLAMYRPLGSVTVSAGQSAVSLTIGENVAVPAGADRIAVYQNNGVQWAGYAMLDNKAYAGQLKVKYAVVSDVHTNYNQGEMHWLNALKQFEAEGVKYIIVSGDIGESNADYAKYVAAVENSGFSGVIMACIGNHDQTVTGSINFKNYAIYDGSSKTWVAIDDAPAYFATQYTGDLDISVSIDGNGKAYYFATIGDNAFMFMDQELGPDGGTTTQDNFSQQQLNFVENNLYAYSATHTLYIVEHAPIEQLKVGDKFIPGYGGCIQLSITYPNNQRFLNLLMEYTEAIWLSGHTHVQYDAGIMYVDKYYDASGNLTDTPIAHSIHVSSLAQPRWYEGTSMIMKNDYSAASQGYVCYQYENDVVYEARVFKNYTPDSTSYDEKLFINEVEAINTLIVPLEMVSHDAPEVIEDLAVADKGFVRQGSVSYEDTDDGLKVTLGATTDRFEIRTGNQAKAYYNGYYLQFKIKTDLTSFTLGGCNYSGSRYTAVAVDLTAPRENYAITDLGDGWKFVQIPFEVLGVVDYLPEFAIRIYNTNAAGTFYLKDMFISPFDYRYMRGDTFVGGVNKTVDTPVPTSDVLSFEYRIIAGSKIYVALLHDWSNYFGYYYFDANGEMQDYAGITTEVLPDGYVRVTCDVNLMTAKNGTPTAISMIYISKNGGDASGYIDNIGFELGDSDEEEETAMDYAVAANGAVRAGSVSFTDTSEGLQVTFAAAGNRFEIKCGDQTAAANGTLQFKIKTDLTSIKLGGCNYSGLRKTTVTVDLTASADGYTVTDLGDGWVLVEVPMSVIGVADYLAEFAIRFYDTNAAGTFYLKDMNFVA